MARFGPRFFHSLRICDISLGKRLTLTCKVYLLFYCMYATIYIIDKLLFDKYYLLYYEVICHTKPMVCVLYIKVRLYYVQKEEIMDQLKIGKFIAECRKQKNLTQMQLAEKLGITDKAISKWERGIAMPDSSIMLGLCDILGISVSDLLRGEKIAVDTSNKELENSLIEAIKQKEEADKRLLKAEIVLCIIAALPLIAGIIFAIILPMEEWKAALLVGLSLIPFLIATAFALKIEQYAGYYECPNCKQRYVPKYSSVFFARHINRTRYMICPKCGKKSWQKKVISKE